MVSRSKERINPVKLKLLAHLVLGVGCSWICGGIVRRTVPLMAPLCIGCGVQVAVVLCRATGEESMPDSVWTHAKKDRNPRDAVIKFLQSER